MKKPLKIEKPSLKHARVLSAMELNNVKFTDKHTVLTPELLESMRNQAQQPTH